PDRGRIPDREFPGSSRRLRRPVGDQRRRPAAGLPLFVHVRRRLQLQAGRSAVRARLGGDARGRILRRQPASLAQHRVLTGRNQRRLFRGGSRSIRPGSVLAGTLCLALVLGLAGVPVAAPHAGVMGPLADSIRTLLAGGQGRETGLLAISLDRGDTLAALHPGLRLIPGSSAKLFTTSAFLHRFGPAARCTTYVEARGRADRKSGGRVRLKGDLILRGSGSPDVTQLLSPGSRGLLDSLAFLLRNEGLDRF